MFGGKILAIELNNHQLKAIEKLKSGSILCGGVGSGKSRTALAFYLFKICNGSVKMNDQGEFYKMEFPRDLYIITTAKKRDSLEWEKECAPFALGLHEDDNVFGVKVTIDSWNNIKKYHKVYGAFFIFDEQRLVGKGAWVKTFLDLARKNSWILLSATPGDTWSDYIPIFIANGFYRNRTEFNAEHCVFSRFSKYPKIERFVGEELLEMYREKVLVDLKDDRNTNREKIYLKVGYDKELYRTVFRERWNPWENCPIEETGKLLYLTRKVVNGDESRIARVNQLFEIWHKFIIFYNFDYELDMLLEWASTVPDLKIGQWNGHRHDEVPTGKNWAYLVQYTAGCEGWNCITTCAMIFFSQNYSYRVMEQAAGRIDRMNSPYPVLYYYHLRSDAPIDLAIYRALLDKKNFNERSYLRRFER